LEADGAVKPFEDAVVIVAQVVARGPHVARVEADPDSVASFRRDEVDYLGKLLEGGAEHVAAACGRLEEHDGITADLGEGAVDGAGVLFEAAPGIAVGRVAGVRDQELDAEGDAAPQLHAE